VQRATSAVLLSLALIGCAGQSVGPVGVDHPANSDAPAAPPLARSNTLALQSDPEPSDPPAPASAAGAVAYACPMHPKVTSSVPGKCPICGMALKPAGARPATQPAGAPDHDHGAHDHGGHE
jgi:hypothetical protein